jgi:hypothetical protein
MDYIQQWPTPRRQCKCSILFTLGAATTRLKTIMMDGFPAGFPLHKNQRHSFVILRTGFNIYWLNCGGNLEIYGLFLRRLCRPWANSEDWRRQQQAPCAGEIPRSGTLYRLTQRELTGKYSTAHAAEKSFNWSKVKGPELNVNVSWVCFRTVRRL